MMTPGKDFNYPTSSGNVSAMQQYLPHGLLGIVVALIVILLIYHLVKGGKRRR